MLVLTFCRADLGMNFLFCPASSRKIAGKFLSEFGWQIFYSESSALFSRVSGHPKNSRPKFTSRIVGIPSQFHFLEPKIYSRRFSASGETNRWIQESFKGGCLEAPKPHSVPFLGDSVRIPGVSPVVTPTFGLQLRPLGRDPNNFTENWLLNHFSGFYSKANFEST